MTRLTKPVRRVAAETLGAQFGPDRNRRLIITLHPGDGAKVPDMLLLKPLGTGTKRTERIAVIDCYRLAMRARVNLAVLEKARKRKKSLALKREARSIKATERRLFSNGGAR